MNNPAPENSVSFHYSFPVEEQHLDALNHVNNVVYVEWINDISGKHWSKITTEALDKNYFWVVIRHEIDYINQAVLGDTITIYTWVGESRGVKSIRHVQIQKGEIVLVKAQTTWCLIDANTFKPTRIKEDIMEVLRPPN